MDIEAVIAALGGHYTTGEAAIVEEYLRNHHGTVPDKQLTSGAALALAIYRRSKPTRLNNG